MAKSELLNYKQARKLFVIPNADVFVRSACLPQSDWAKRFPTWVEAKALWPDIEEKHVRSYRACANTRSHEEYLKLIQEDRWDHFVSTTGPLWEALGISIPYGIDDEAKAELLSARIESEEAVVDYISSHLELVEQYAPFAITVLKHEKLAAALIAKRL